MKQRISGMLKPNFGNYSETGRAITAIVLFICLAGSMYYCAHRNQEAKIDIAKLEKELNLIKPMDNAVLKEHFTSKSWKHMFVTEVYSVNMTFSTISEYYDRELLKQGWKFNREEMVKDWGRDFGVLNRIYCKNEYIAYLQSSGNKSNNGWTYLIALSMDLHDWTGFFDKNYGKVRLYYPKDN